MADLQLIVVDGPNQGTEFDISGSSVIGRDPSSGIVLDDPEASRRHASVSASGDVITVEDLGSTNGTYVAGERIQGSREVGSGDRIRIGTTVMEVRVAAAATALGAVDEDPQATRIGGMPIPDAPPSDAGEPGGDVAGGPAEPPTMPEPAAPAEPAAPEPAAFETSGPPEPPTGEPAAFESGPAEEPAAYAAPPPPEPPAPEPPTAPEPPAYEPPPPPPEPPTAPEPPAAIEPPARARARRRA
jgi:predicted component of type VI protein secretion system